MTIPRRFPVGAEVRPDGLTHFRVWAPACRRVAVAIENGPTHPLTANGDGYFAADVPATAGTRYRFWLDDDDSLYPDPASRYQPDGPHGPSQVVDPAAFRWTDADWKGVPLAGQVVYELHIGTFTREGTWAAAARELPELAAAGITCLEVMPVNDFPGRFGWGYDGVNLYAPTRLYGTPDDFRRFVDEAHRHGLGVILDVVYNHLGPDGNYLKKFAPAYFTDKYKTEWGEAINFDGPDSGPVREFFAGNAAYWIDEFHLDGLRLDATQNVYDDTPDPPKHIIAEIGRRVRAAAKGRATILVAENEPQDPNLVRPLDRGGFGLDAVWNDDFHHSAMVALTGRNEAYYTDYLGDPQEFVSAIKYGYLYQGQWYSWQEKNRGRPGLDVAPAAFVTFTQNHDQVANSGRGFRAHQLTSPGRYRAMHALTLLAPGTPMLFQGQEFAASAPFLYFADHQPDLAKLVQTGRAEFLAQFKSLTDPKMLPVFAPPHEAETFERCKLDFADRERNAPAYQLTKDLLRLRREDPAFRLQRYRGLDGAVLGPQAFVLRYFTEDGRDRLLLVNFGREFCLKTCPEPLLAAPAGTAWEVVFSTEDPAYGGGGVGPVVTEDAGWRVAGEAASVLIPKVIDASAPRRAPGRVGGGRRIVY
ncbi:MAG TPA: malto-oligosyltrehalose trehalohydrolase [Gemmataceae bacterium]|nr:malto-oligosyltrehalose trehalohydrolase [Gemmataceae bacterium]